MTVNQKMKYGNTGRAFALCLIYTPCATEDKIAPNYSIIFRWNKRRTINNEISIYKYVPIHHRSRDLFVWRTRFICTAHQLLPVAELSYTLGSFFPLFINSGCASSPLIFQNKLVYV